jgi:septin family protein
MPDENVHLGYLKTYGMKKLTLLAVFIWSFSLCLVAQPPIEPVRRYEGTVEYQKTQQPATILEFRYPAKELENAMEAYVEKQGGKIKQQKGFTYVKSMRIHERENRYYDMYYRIEGSGKGANAMSKIYVILAEPGENILLRSQQGDNAAKAAASVGAVSFFGAMGSEVGSYDLERKLKEQQEEVDKAARRKTELEKKRERLLKELDETTQDLERQANELEKAKTILEQLKSSKKN